MVHTSYCLQAMIIHIGVSMHAVHYRSVLVTGDRRWYYTNDNAEAVLVHRVIGTLIAKRSVKMLTSFSIFYARK